MKLTLILLIVNILQVTANTFAQNLTLKKSNANLTEVFKEIRKQSGYDFFYSDKLLKKSNPVSINVKDENLINILNEIFNKQPLKYSIKGTTIILKEKKNYNEVFIKNEQNYVLSGKVTDINGFPLIGVTVYAFKSKSKTKTDHEGVYQLPLTQATDSIRFSYLGYGSQTFVIRNQKILNVKLEQSENQMQQVVVTGIYSRPKESFTGSATTYTGKELKSIGTQNIIQSLKTLDPVFAVIENNQFGSDPNQLPNLEIRGKSSVVGLRDEFGTDPNQPLFILDGFETTLRTIVDLDMERVATVTILKDAASTAIYGSKAANGVVVIETKQPIPGQLRVSYNSNFNVSSPDFSSYNLMNAQEKLQFELLAGRYSYDFWDDAAIEKLELYNKRLAEVERGVDTYWLNEPIRTGINQRQSIYAEGGDANMRYGIGANYNGIQGVMKESKRNTISGNVDLMYRKNKFIFSNKLMVNHSNFSNPLVPFSSYSRANPYYKKQNEEGLIDKWLENSDIEQTENPLWNDHLNSRNVGKENGFNNNFSAEYALIPSLRFRARFGLTNTFDDSDNFISPENTVFDEIDPLLKGTLTYRTNNYLKYEGELSATYGALIKQNHRINAVFAGNLNSSSSKLYGFTAQGFSKGDYTTVAFAKGYQENGRPTYNENIFRSNSIYGNLGYAFMDRYLFDVNYRLNGSSVFGTNKRFTNTWSTGLAWNLHEESFIKNIKAIELLKLRASIGNPGNQNFDGFQTFTTYMFSNSSASYFGEAVSLAALGNPNLKWQVTLDKNIGLDLSLLNRRLNLNLDYFNKVTDPLLISIGVPSSIGVNSVLTNLGEQQSKGFNGMLVYSPILDLAKRKIWSLRANFRTESSKIDKIGNLLDKFNEGEQNLSLRRYYDGANPDALWTVKSAGIDPSTGKEIFIKKDGTYTFDYNYDDEIIVGINRPKIEGTIGSSFTYKGFSANIDFRYRYGGQAFNSALFNKVENLDLQDLRYNQDKRALYDRWQKPGDKSLYKGISLKDVTPMSSRFVQDNNSFSLESLRLGYEFDGDWIKRAHLRSLRLNAYMNEMFVISTIKTERGIDYPFARTVSFSASISF